MLGKTMYMWNKGRGIIKQPVDVGDVVSGVVEAFKDRSDVIVKMFVSCTYMCYLCVFFVNCESTK